MSNNALNEVTKAPDIKGITHIYQYSNQEGR